MPVFYFVYETTNLINGKRYIGKHTTSVLDDNYIGSGILLRKSIAKYGRQNFERRILCWCTNDEELNQKEAEYITEEVIQSDEYYNIANGGQGGCIILDRTNPRYDEIRDAIKNAQLNRSTEISEIVTQLHRDRLVGMYGRKQSDKQKLAVSKALKGRKHDTDWIEKQRKSLLNTTHKPSYVNPRKGVEVSEDTRRKISENHHDVTGDNNPMYGKNHSDETKRKISEKAKQRKKVECPQCGRVITESQLQRHYVAKHK